jgi:hypothetical protein
MIGKGREGFSNLRNNLKVPTAKKNSLPYSEYLCSHTEQFESTDDTEPGRYLLELKSGWPEECPTIAGGCWCQS